ncbi:ATP-binding cassette domain-containing protein [Allomuricauda sp. d1]|uniref:ATP-binding cassette domain-containing protein n=1 Tax=Allomuricauda sp. d1 TaxID=3136725 RepID=UPI0031DAA3DC
MQHWGIRIDNQSETRNFIAALFQNPPKGFEGLSDKKGALFSDSEIGRYLDEEERHDLKLLTANTQQSLKTMSSGERKKALLAYLLKQHPDFLVLVNPYDNLDAKSQESFKSQLRKLSKSIVLIQLVGRMNDLLFEITTDFGMLKRGEIQFYNNRAAFLENFKNEKSPFTTAIPPPLHPIKTDYKELVVFDSVSVSFEGRQVLQSIHWTIKKREFWNLIGPNGSGKSTLLNMITGDSHKGYGQNLTLFGQKKGSGESVWDIKQHIGYFTPAMTDKFRGYHTIENMLISGLHDSIGLYVTPSDAEKRLADHWLRLLKLNQKKDRYFHELPVGEKRLLMTARAMVKHPPLLILDEPTAGLDDDNAHFFVSLVNKIAEESQTTIIFVSHRMEPRLEPNKLFELLPTKEGSRGMIKSI